jgi:DNA recombination protein RmuC
VTEILSIVNVIAMCAVAVLLLLMLRKTSNTGSPALDSRLNAFEKAQERTERAVREEVAKNRDELNKTAREQRQELTEAFKGFGDSVVKRMLEVATMQKGQLEIFSGQLGSFSQVSGEKLDGARIESAAGAKQLREEVVATLNGISETMSKTMRDLAAAEKGQLEAFSGQIGSLTQTSGEKLDGIRTESASGGKQLREEVISGLKGVTDTTTRTMGEMANVQKGQLQTMSLALEKLSGSNEQKLEAIRETVAVELRRMQADNATQLEHMRQTVDEKLQGTLEKRLAESFKQVSERLEQVHKGLGEMQSLATGVGDLKKVLTNVKTRGTWGEVQLGALLEQVLSPDQFAKNVATKGTRERVEFAIKLPGQGVNKDEILWLPIDAKFPVEDYQRLCDAQERANIEEVEIFGKQLENRVKACARDICDKYLNPPNTTDFGILFLPIEGLFAEVIRRTGLIEAIQRECRVVIAGPTTLWSILNSLQMGFRTLAIQKRSSEVWNLLAAVKTEWSKYGDVLAGVQKKLQQASDTIDQAQVRTRAIGRKLSGVQELSGEDTTALLGKGLLDGDDENAEPIDVDGVRVNWQPVSTHN